MSKRLVKYYFSFIALLMVIATIASVPKVGFKVFADSSLTLGAVTQSESQINKGISYAYINTPTQLTGSATNFFVTDKAGNLYSFASNKLSATEHKFTNLLDFKYLESASKILALDGGKLSEISAVDFSIIATHNDIVGNRIDTDGVYLAVATEDSITLKTDDLAFELSKYYIDEYNTANFGKIKDICIYNNVVYVLVCSETTSRVNLIKVDIASNLNESKATIVKQISFNTKSDFEMNACASGLVLREESSLKLYSFAGSLIANLLSEYTHFERSFKSGEIIAPIGFITYGGKIIIADKIANSIQQFGISNSALTFEKLLVASSGSDIDRLNEASNATLFGENAVVVSDSGNSRLIVHDLMSGKNAEIVLRAKPNLVASTTTGELYVYTRPTLLYYDDFVTGDCVSTQSASTEYNLSAYNIVDMATDSQGDVYLLDSSTNSLLKYASGGSVESVKTLEFTVQQSSKMVIDASGKLAFVLSNNKIYSINLTSKECNEVIAVNASDTSIDFSIDYRGNIYLLVKGVDDTLRIDKYNIAYAYLASKTLSCKDYTALSLNINSGKFYGIDSCLQVINEINFADFAENLSSFVNDMRFISSTPFTQKVVVGKVKNATYCYKYPFMISPIMQFERGFEVIVLEQECKENAMFAYCLIANKNSNNFLCYIPNESLDVSSKDIAPAFETVKVITAYAYLYKLPTSLSFDDESNLKLEKVAYQNEEYQIIGYASGYKDFYGNSYLTIKLEDGSICYMKAFNAMNAMLDVYQETFQPNAHLSIVLKSDVIKLFEKEVDELDETLITYKETTKALKNNTKVFISKNDFSTDNEYTKIVYVNENNEQLSAYVDTKFVCLDRDMMPHVQIGLVLLPISIILIIIVAVFAYKYINKRKLEASLSQIENE